VSKLSVSFGVILMAVMGMGMTLSRSMLGLVRFVQVIRVSCLE
jgi:hypothetical protein